MSTTAPRSVAHSVVGQLAGLTHPTDRQLVVREDLLERVGVGDPGGELPDDLAERVEVRHPVGDVAEPWIVGELGSAHRREEEVERAPFGRMSADHERLAVGDREHEVVAGAEAADPVGIVVAAPTASRAGAR